jgi:DNA-binding CsgD family transcriptional regulator
MKAVSPRLLGAVVDRLALPVFIFREHWLLYSNEAARVMTERFQHRYSVELRMMLIDHLRSLAEAPDGSGSAVTLITGFRAEPLYVHVLPLKGHKDCVAVTVRHPGAEIEAFRKRYRLSSREAQVAELVLQGYRNRDIAGTLGITAATTKKHLTHVFDKVGVDSRSQLASRLA